MSANRHHLVYLNTIVEHPRGSLISEVMEGKAIQPSSSTEPVPNLTHGNLGDRKGTLRIRGYLIKLLNGGLT